MILDKIIVSDIAPKNTGVVWIKPINDSYEQHIFLNNKWSKISDIANTKTTEFSSSDSSLNCEENTYYKSDDSIETLNIILPSVNNSDTLKTILIYLTVGETPAITISAIDNKPVYYAKGFKIEAGKTYEINALWNGSAWIVANIEIVIE